MSYVSDFMDNYSASFYDMLLEYVDTEYSLWLTWFLTPVVVTFLLPAVLIILIYISSIIFYLYRLYRLKVVDGVQNDWRQAARVAVCALWDAHGWLWHGYEIRGVENIPQGPFLVIYYHGALPIDMYYFTARIMLFQRRLIHTVADRLLFKIPGWASLLEGLCVIPGTVQTCAGVLRSGNPLAISPGGVYEAQFGDHYYKLKWKSRIGFAKVAQEAKVPIIPMFTQNVREAFRTVGWLRGVWLRIYSAVRVPLAPVYGGFPVKLITHLGPPIYPQDEDTPEDLQKKVAAAIEKLIEEHQRVPGNIFTALIERVYELPKNKHKSEKEKHEENSERLLANSEKLADISEKLPANSEKLPANSDKLPANSEKPSANSEKLSSNSEKLLENSEKLPENSEILIANSENLPKVSEKHTNGKCHNGVVKVTDNAQSDSESGKQKVS